MDYYHKFVKRIGMLAFASALVSAPSIGYAKHYRVYLVGGQSNATGRGDAAQLTGNLSHLASAQTNVLFYHHQDLPTDNLVLEQDAWIDLAPGSGCGQIDPVHDVEFGPEVAFGYDLAAADPARNIAIIKYAYGGSNLHTHWSATGAKYTAFVETVNAALDALAAEGHTYEVCGMIWQQGEADTSAANAANYEANLTALIARVRSEFLGGLNRPFVIGSLSINQTSDVSDPTTGYGTVRAAQEAVASAVSQAGFVDTDAMDVWADENIHFDGIGQAALGAAHAAQMLALEANDADDDGLTIAEETALGTSPDNSDSDSDGQNDGIEVLAGTNPADSNSLFKVTSIVVATNGVTLTWPSKPGNVYQVEHSGDLSAWTDAELDYPASESGSNTVWSNVETDSTLTSILALYDAQTANNGDFNTDAFDSVDTDSSTTATRLTQGGSLTGGGSEAFVLANALFDASASGSPGFNLADVNLASQSAAATAGDWFTFTLQANGETVTYDSISFYADQHLSGAKVDVSYTEGGTETFVLQNYEPVGANASVALVEVDFPNFSSTNDVVWTFYLYGAPSDINGTRFDDIALYGSVSADILALYDAQTEINGDFNTTSFDSVDTAGGTTATRLSQGGSLTGGGSDAFVLGNTIFDTSPSGSPGFNLAGTMTVSQSAAATAGDWFSFTLESGGATVTYESLSFYSNQHKTGAKLDVSYTVGESETFILQDYVMPENNVALVLKTVDFADFSSAGNVVWTFYLYGAAAEINGNRFDDITLYGASDAVVDEPAAGFYRVNLQ
jgi:hypothetical protein